MQHHPRRLRSVFLGATAVLAISAGGVPADAQPQPASPLAAVSSDTRSYPDGSQARLEYDLPNAVLPAAGAAPRAALSATAALAAAAQGQAGLMGGLTILPGQTREIGSAAGGAAAARAAVGAPSPEEKFITVHPLAYQGVPLAKTSDYMTIVSGDSRLLLSRKRGLPSQVDGTTPSNTADAAMAAAQQMAGQNFAAATVRRSTPNLEIWVDDQQAGHLSWTFTLDNGSLEAPDMRRYWVAAMGEPLVLHWETEIYHTHHGLLTANVWTTSPVAMPPTDNRAIPGLRVTRAPGGATFVTGPDGRYGYTTGMGNAQITATLQGPFAQVQNQAGANLQVVRPGGTANPIDINFGAGTEFELAQSTAFYWTNFAHTLAKPALGPAALANLPVNTSINANCNAFWNGSSINFFRAGGGCPNTAYSDVVLHEFGHGVDAVNGGILDGGYSEGVSDALAVMGTRQSCLGRDFLSPGSCLRNAADLIMWPLPAGSGVHLIGRPYAGFAWQLVQELKKTYSDEDAFQIASRLIVGAAAANPANVPDAVLLSFVVDAPDGNPAHGSPHFTELAAAAASRNIPHPSPPLLAGGSRSSSATFPWTPVKQVSANSVILQTAIHLDQPSAVHMVANTSAMSNAAQNFQTGFLNSADPNSVWTNSYRNLAVSANQWTNLGSTSAVNLPAGDHTIYWKIWISGGTLSFSSGTLLVEAFASAGSTLNIASADGMEPTTMAAAAAGTPPMPVIDTNPSGQSVTTASAR